MPLAALIDRFVSPLVLAAAGCALAGTADAQFVPLSGNVSDGAGGPLLSGVVYHATGLITVPFGTTLTVQPGAIVKLTSNDQNGFPISIEVHGTLDVNGTAASPVIFTSLWDDAAGGDTNGDGPSVGTPYQWRGLHFNGSADTSTADHLIVRNGGNWGWPLVVLSAADVTLRDCVIERAGEVGMDLNGNSLPTVERCTIRDNGLYAVNQVPLDAVPGFLDCQASGNGWGDYLHVTSATTTASRTIGVQNLLNGVLVSSAHWSIAAGTTFVLQAGVVVKMRSSDLTVEVYGVLLAEGTEAAPVVFTSFADDTYGGDTNVDGPSIGSPTQWRGIRFNSESDASVLDYLIVRCGGTFSWDTVILNHADVTMRDCTFTRSGQSGLGIQGISLPSVVRCSFVDNWYYAVDGVPLDAVPGFVHCTASSNGLGNFLAVKNGSVTGNRTIGLSNLINGALVLYDHGNVTAGASLTLLPGVVVKFRHNTQIVDAFGALNVRGTGARPVVFTSFADDEHAGDTNQDGPSTGSPLGWNGIRIWQGSASLFEYALVRYGGNFGWPMLNCYSPQATVRSVRAEHSGDRGFYIQAHGAPTVFNLVAFDCWSDGIELHGAGFDVAHATSVNNGGVGIRNMGFFTGLVTGAISWGNAANFAGFPFGQVVASNGDQATAGSLGNLFQDPAFADQANGDLHLTHGSGMLDHADLGYAVDAVRDHEENSRLLDDDINSAPVADMGAYELSFWWMTTDGEPRLGETLTFMVQSYAGLSIYLLGFLDGPYWLSPFGMVSAGTASLQVLGVRPVGTSLSVSIPASASALGVEFGVQTATFPLSTLDFGNVTNLYRGIVIP